MPRLTAFAQKLLLPYSKILPVLSSGYVIMGYSGGFSPPYTTHSAYSSDGSTWISSTLPVINTFWGWVDYGNGRYIAVRSSQVTNVSAYSDDNGETWTQRNLPASPSITPAAIRYADGTWIVTSNGGTVGFTSVDDGETWTTRTLAATSGQWLDLAYGDGNWVAVDYAFAGTTRAIYSTDDGATWNPSTLPLGRWFRIAYGNGTFVAVREQVGDQAAYSTNGGVTWTATTLPSSQDTWRAIAYGAGLFVVLCNGTATATSPDGVSWTQRTISNFGIWDRLIFKDGQFVASGVANINRVALSSDGINWTYPTLPANANWIGLG